MPLECGVHQLGASAPSRCCLDDGEFDPGQLQAAPFDDVRAREVAATNSRSVAAPAVAVARHGHLDGVGREPGDTVPPRGSQATGRSARPITPDRRANARGIGEWAVVDEVHAQRASAPNSGANPAIDGVLTQSGCSALGQCDHTVMAAKQVFEHVRSDVFASRTVPSSWNWARSPAPTAAERAEIAGEGAICGGCPRTAVRGSPGRESQWRRHGARRPRDRC